MALSAAASRRGESLFTIHKGTHGVQAMDLLGQRQPLANAVPYLQAFGHTVLAWVWLDVALAVLRQNAAVSVAASQGRLRATAYFYHYELPKIGAWLQVVKSADLTCALMGEDEF